MLSTPFRDLDLYTSIPRWRWWAMENKKKSFDCVEMKRQGAEAIRRVTQGMTHEEELEYWQRGTAEFMELQKKLQEASLHPSKATPLARRIS
jgi:hypothetical protein